MSDVVMNESTGEIIDVSTAAPDAPETWSRCGLHLPADLTFARWQEIGTTLREMERSVMWWIGDWLRFGEQRWGEMYDAAQQVTGLDQKTLRNAKWVCRQYSDLSLRRDNLGWSHHANVAALSEPERTKVLQQAEQERWSVRDLKSEVSRRKNAKAVDAPQPNNETCTVSDLNALAEQGYKFGTIYADPPWQYSNQATRSSTGNHYDGMTPAEIAALPVRHLIAENAHLHLWTTNAFLFECKEIMEAWGFEYRSCFVWCKPKLGIGNYWRVSHEFMLFGKRGKAPFYDHSLRSWAELERGKHSAKPERVRDMIERASPGPYLELFARHVAPGWAAWGDQVERNLMTHNVREVA